jgi:hypothetical protein
MTQSPATPPTLRRDERGMALALAIFALVIIATLVAGVFFMARLEQRSGSNSLWSIQAAEAAEAGLSETLDGWTGSYNTLALGASAPLATQSLPGSANQRYTAEVQRLSPQIFLIRSRGERTGGAGVLAGTTVGRVVRLTIPDLDISAALTANGPVSVAGSSRVDGQDVDPTNWPACTTKDTVAGVRTSQTLTLVGGNAQVIGDPNEIENDATITPAMFTTPYAAFAAMATPAMTFSSWPVNQRPGPTASGGTCTYGTLNWGEPWRLPEPGTVPECTGYSPIIHITGNAQLAGAGANVGRGQGILLVGGDLDLSGNFEFVGIVIVLGEIRTTGTGNKIMGAVLAANAQIGDVTSMSGNPEVIYSSCSISTVMLQSAVARPLAERSWVQLY